MVRRVEEDGSYGLTEPPISENAYDKLKTYFKDINLQFT